MFWLSNSVTSVLVLLICCIAPLSFANAEDCSWLLRERPAIFDDAPPPELAFEDVSVAMENHELLQMIDPDLTKNLAVAAPMTVMNAAQKLLTLIYSQPVTEVQLPWMGGKTIPYYSFFSDGSEATRGVRIVGNLDIVHKFVQSVRAQARRDRSGVRPLALIGPGATGKTEFVRTTRAGFQTQTGPYGAKFPDYTYELFNLHEIPALRDRLTSDGKGGSMPVAAPMNDSPLVMLPKYYQDLVISWAAPKVKEMTGGEEPLPHLDPESHSAFYRDEILKHYNEIALRETGKPLDTYQMVLALNRHVRIKRVNYGAVGGALPIIESQGNDVPVASLFMSPNIFNRDLGARHPLYWQLNGKISGSHGNLLTLEEVFKNATEMLNFLLPVLESRVLDLNGAPRTAFDAVILAASNKKELEEARKDEKKAPLIGRFHVQKMGYLVRPHEIADALLYQKQSTLEVESLTESNTGEDSQPRKVKARELFPLPELGKKVQGPDGNFRLYSRAGRKLITIAPHTILFMSEIMAATRYITSIRGYEAMVSEYRIASAPVFRDEIQRILYHEGQLTLEDNEVDDLERLLGIVEEGHTGMNPRFCGEWLKEALAEAEREENGLTLTPDLAFRVFKQMLLKHELGASSIAEEVEWLTLADMVSQSLLLPRLEEDFSQALTMNNSEVEATYRQVVLELKALDVNPGAKSYVVNGTKRDIKTDRLAKIAEIFQTREHRALIAGQLFRMEHEMDPNMNGLKPRRYEELYRAVVAYHAQKKAEDVNYPEFYNSIMTGEGDEEQRQATDSFMRGMRRLGYNDYAARVAVGVVDRLRAEGPEFKKKLEARMKKKLEQP